MKKFVAGVIVGALFMVSAQAFGDSVNFVGKKVAKESVVKVNGEDAGKAIIVDNKSFVPVRDISEKIGATISFEKGGAIALSINQSNGVSGSSADVEEAIKKQEAEIADTKNKIDLTSEKVQHYSDLISSAINEERRKTYQLNYDAFKKSLDQLEADLKNQEATLAGLKSQLNQP